MDGNELQPDTLQAGGERLPGEVLETGGLEAEIAVYRKALEANPEEYDFSEEVIIINGLGLVETSSDSAIALLLVVTAVCPDSADIWDSVGYAYRQAGDKAKAIEYFKEVLRRDTELASTKNDAEGTGHD